MREGFHHQIIICRHFIIVTLLIILMTCMLNIPVEHASAHVITTDIFQVAHTSSDAIYLTRHVGLRSGMRIEAPALTVNRLCGSGKGRQRIIGILNVVCLIHVTMDVTCCNLVSIHF